jgi:hypothetical protein
MPRSRSRSMESRNCARASRSETALVACKRRSASVLLPWSMWAMMEKLRIFTGIAQCSRRARSIHARKSRGNRGFARADQSRLVSHRQNRVQSRIHVLIHVRGRFAEAAAGIGGGGVVWRVALEVGVRLRRGASSSSSSKRRRKFSALLSSPIGPPFMNPRRGSFLQVLESL